LQTGGLNNKCYLRKFCHRKATNWKLNINEFYLQSYLNEVACLHGAKTGLNMTPKNTNWIIKG